MGMIGRGLKRFRRGLLNSLACGSTSLATEERHHHLDASPSTADALLISDSALTSGGGGGGSASTTSPPQDPCSSGVSDDSPCHAAAPVAVALASATDSPAPHPLPLDGERSAGVLIIDLVSIHASILSSSIADLRSSEARRNPHDRWLLDFSGDLQFDRATRESRYHSSRRRERSGRRWPSRYEMFHDVHDERDWRASSLCDSGIHPRGTCFCDSPTAEEPSSRSRVSQIFMLADALFEVLEEIHRQRLSLSLSMVSIPAPEVVVDSLPLKSYEKSSGADMGIDDVLQCHICLEDYEEGDQIRALPCSHEYHMSCVDKWLKEVQGVCPLCRGDVCKDMEGSTSNPQVSSA